MTQRELFDFIFTLPRGEFAKLVYFMTNKTLKYMERTFQTKEEIIIEIMDFRMSNGVNAKLDDYIRTEYNANFEEE